MDKDVEKIARSRNQPYAVVQRAKAWVWFKNERRSIKEIAFSLQRSEACVREWLHRIKDLGILGLYDRDPLKEGEIRNWSNQKTKPAKDVSPRQLELPIHGTNRSR